MICHTGLLTSQGLRKGVGDALENGNRVILKATQVVRKGEQTGDHNQGTHGIPSGWLIANIGQSDPSGLNRLSVSAHSPYWGE
jgi:hypothetical protein